MASLISSVAQRLLIQVEEGQLTLVWQRGGRMPRMAEPVAFEHPFDSQALAQLRWYLEEYLSFPYGIEPQKAEAVEGRMRDWGQALFELVFNRQGKAWEFFQEAVREGLDQCELAVICDDPAVLNLPWELLYSPDEGYVAPLLGGMYRSLSGQKVRAALPELPQDQLNVLLVIARPYGEQDIALQTIARPVLAAVQGLGHQVNLKVLRPPTFAALEKELSDHKGFYHIVHFDGHGSFDPDAQGLQSRFGEEPAGQGVLVFEQWDGRSEIVTAQKLAQSLQNCRVPLFLLNACKSGQAGEDAFSSVAGQLVRLGAKGVVAMAYSVYAVAAKYFIGRVYGELVQGATVAEAVAAGRREVLNRAGRPSPKGELNLQDWMVPVLYQQESYRPFVPRPQAASAAAGFGALMDQVEQAESEAVSSEVGNLIGFPELGAYGFVGRDYEILRLERAFRQGRDGQQNNVALLKGMGGVGKTALAQGFATWLMQTQGREAAFFTSFESGAGLSQVVNQIGRALGGDRFVSMMPEQQRQVVTQYLREHPCLLVWDNFEPVNGFPAGNMPLLSEDERGALLRFLKELRGGQSWVLITSRRQEDWLDCGSRLVELKGLSVGEAELLAAEILAGAGVDRTKLPGEYVELLKLLGGHPLSLRVVLPLLKQQSPAAVMEALRLGLAEVDGEEEGRDRSLTASLDYSFGRLSERAQRHFPFLALFCDRVDADWLHAFAHDAENDFGQVYRAVFGENLQKADWVALLNEAAQAGIVELLGAEIYKIHPALPWFLRRRLVGQGNDKPIEQLEQQLIMFYASLADSYRQALVGQAEQAMFVLGVEEPNLLQQLRRSELGEQWAEVQALLQALGEMYERTGRKAEFGALRQRALGRVGEHLEEVRQKGRDAFDFWRYLRVADGHELLAVADLDGAGAVYQEILEELLSLEDDAVLGSIAVQYHQLGVVAQEQRRFDAAIANYNKALKIYEDAGDFYKAASDYHQLGMVAQEQRQFEVAIANYNKALKIYEDAGNFYQAAPDYHHLGRVAQEQRKFDVAIANYNKALKIYEDAGDFYKAANEYHQLGVVAQEQRQFDVAILNYVKAFSIFSQAQDEYKVGFPLRQLAALLQTLGPESFQATWQTATGDPCPTDLLTALQQALED